MRYDRRYHLWDAGYGVVVLNSERARFAVADLYAARIVCYAGTLDHAKFLAEQYLRDGRR